MNAELRDAILEVARANQWDPLDLATVMSYETGGTFDPWKRGPTTQWGTHRGLIQWGEPQARKYGVTRDTPIRDQVHAAGKYLLDRGVKPGDGLLPIYAAINAGHASRINATDENNGGAPGTVLDKVRDQMDGHRRNASQLIGGEFRPITISGGASSPMQNPAQGNLNSSYMDIPLPNPKPIQMPDPTRDDVSLWQLQKDAWNVEQTIPWLFQGAGNHAPDPQWSLDGTRLQADLKDRGLPLDQYADRMGKSHSEAHYLTNLQSAQEDFARVTRLAEAGMTGTSLRLANAILDPVALAADIAAASVAPQFVLANKATRMGRALTAGVAGAAGGAAAEGVALSVNPHRDQMDLLMGTVFGFGVGGAIGSMMGNPAVARETQQFQRAAQRAIDEVEANMPGSVGAARAPQQNQFLDEDGLAAVQANEIAETAFGSIRADLSAWLQKSNSPIVKMMAGLVQDGTGKKGGAINSIAASEDQSRLYDEFQTAYMRAYRPQFDEYRKANEGGGSRAEIESRFNEEVDSYIRDRRPGRQERYHPAVIAMGNRQAKLQSELLDMLKNPFNREGLEGRPVFGTENIPNDAHYAMRVWDPDKVVAFSRSYEKGTLERFFEGSMISANPTLNPELANRTAKAFARAITNRAFGLDDVAVRGLSAGDMDTVAQALRHHGQLSEADAAALVKSLGTQTAKDAGRDARAKHRLLLDEQYRMVGARKLDGTTDDVGFGFDDLIVRDAASSFQRYSRSVTGMVALARFRVKDPQTGQVLINGITSDREFEQLLDTVRRQWAQMVQEGRVKKNGADEDIKRLEYAYAAIRGRPLHGGEDDAWGMAFRAMRKFQFARIMNQVGFAQLNEIANVVGQLGVKAAFSQVPALRRIINMDGETALRSGLADDLESAIGIGADRVRGIGDYRFDDMTGAMEHQHGGWYGKLDRTLNKASRITNEISGMNQANIMLYRWAGAAAVQRFANLARKGGKLSSGVKARMADLGLSEEMTGRIMRMLNDEGNMEYRKGLVSGRKVSRMHLDRWADKEAAEAFRSALHRQVYQIIQRNDVGNLAMWMSMPFAKVILQFRSFIIGAWAKQTLKALHFRDGPAAISTLMSLGIAGAVYAVQTKLQGMGRSDKDDFEEKRLAWDKVIAAGISRSAQASIIPMLLDTALYTGGGEGLFSHTRTTGQVSNMAWGNPSANFIDDLTSATRGLAGTGRDGPWSQEEARHALRVLPFGNALPLVIGYNHLISNLPERAPRER